MRKTKTKGFYHRPDIGRTRTAVLLTVLAAAAFATRYAGDFEELGTSARAIGMGGAVVAAASDPSAIYYNPSRPSGFSRTSVLFLHSEEHSGMVKHNYLGVSFHSPRQSLGFAVLHNGIPGIKLTKLPSESVPGDTTPEGPNNRPYVWRMVSATQVVGYANYARTLSPYVAVGGNVKLIYHDLGVGSAFGMGLDLGATLTPMADLDVGLRVRNASTSPLFWDTGRREVVMPRGAIGLAKTFRISRDRLTLALEAEANTEELVFTPSYGIEYAFREVLYGRLGVYRGNLAIGLGLRIKRFHVDYGYASGTAPDSRELGSPQQISGGFEF
ncbi:hypothetical protein FJY68_02445 [candidate division WOR-3 bacterium]|uniref:PorV/PorQ family protein n=1 Tax=candidate division WOR-3 bacterium TaxID=2052148 RepID=A0A937XBM4_UNCW3|nr:hypothetical protein [candidate division WOR-3 bacterium]